MWGAICRAIGVLKRVCIKNKRCFLVDYGERLCGVKRSGLSNGERCVLTVEHEETFFPWEAGRPRGGFSAGVALQLKPILFLPPVSEKTVCCFFFLQCLSYSVVMKLFLLNPAMKLPAEQVCA